MCAATGFFGLLLGLIVLFVGRTFPLPSGQGRCRRCLYDVHGLTRGEIGHLCPECGADLDKPDAVRLTAPRRKITYAGLIIIAVSVASILIGSSWWSSLLERNTPFSWVLRSAKNSGEYGNDALLVLRTRLMDQPPDPEDLERFLDVAMAPPDPATGLQDARWFPLLSGLHFSGQLSSAELAAWLQLTPPDIRLGRLRSIDPARAFPVPYEIELAPLLDRPVWGIRGARSTPGDDSLFVRMRIKDCEWQRTPRRKRGGGGGGYFGPAGSWDPGERLLFDQNGAVYPKERKRFEKKFEFVVSYELNGQVLAEFVVVKEIELVPNARPVEAD